MIRRTPLPALKKGRYSNHRLDNWLISGAPPAPVSPLAITRSNARTPEATREQYAGEALASLTPLARSPLTW